MGTFKTYSKSIQKPIDVFEYDFISKRLRNQVFYIWMKCIEQRYFDSDKLISDFWEEVYKTIVEESGLKSLYSGAGYMTHKGEIENHFDDLTDADKILDVIGIVFHYLKLVEKHYSNRYGPPTDVYTVNDAIADVNVRFRENATGYEYRNDQFIKIGNEFLHKEIIASALNFLNDELFANAKDEYWKALEHFRHKRNPECLNDCLKAFESTMKIICEKKQWAFDQSDTARPLIRHLIENKFLPSYNESSLNALKQLLEGSIPTIRNKNSAHGQGTVKIVIPDTLANYMLYITGATLQLLVETYNSNKEA